MSQFIPNEIKKFVPRDPPWITKSLKCMLNRKNRLFKNYKRHGVIRKKKKLGFLHFALSKIILLNKYGKYIR